MTVIPLSEGSFTVDTSKQFIPFDDKRDKLEPGPSGSLLIEVQPFALVTTQEVLLLDTGLGFTDGKGKMQLHQNLQYAGVDPSSVTKVLLSHLHKDHAGGVGKESGFDSKKQLSFPGATYYVQQKELEFALEKGAPSFLTDQLEVLNNSSRVILLREDRGSIGDNIIFEVTAAHSPYHQVFWITEGSEIFFYGGDDAPHLSQMKHRFIARYDFNGKKAAELRQEWRKKGQAENWTFLFFHDSKHPVWKF